MNIDMNDIEFRKMLAETEVNNTFDLDIVEDTLKQTVENSYWYLYRLQRNVCKYKQYYIKDSKKDGWNVRNNIEAFEYYIDEKNRVCMYIDADLVYEHAREEFYASKYYKSEFTLMELNKHPKIFERIPLINIDFKYHLDIKVKMDNGQTVIILNKQKDFLFDRDDLIHHITNIELITNEKILIGETNKSNIELSENKVKISHVSFNVNEFEKFGTYKIILAPPDNYTGRLEFLDKWAFCKSGYYNYLKSGNDDYRIDSLEIDNPEIANIWYNFLQTVPIDFKVYAFYYKNLTQYKSPRDNSYKIPIHKKNSTSYVELMTILKNNDTGYEYDMPIPIENMITYGVNKVFTGETNRTMKHIVPLSESIIEKTSTSNFKLIYPVFYEIKHQYMVDYNTRRYTDIGENGNVDYYTSYYFYMNIEGSHKYKNLAFLELSYLQVLSNEARNWHISFNNLYHDIVTNNEDNFFITNRDSIKTYIMNHINKVGSYDYKYNIIDYLDLKKNNNLIHSYKYKVDRLIEFIKNDGFILRDYAVKQNDLTDTYTLDLRKLGEINLQRRLRNNTSGDIIGINDIFDKPMYLFKLQLDNYNDVVVNVWVYGLKQYNHKIYTVGEMIYIYIPKESIDYIYRPSDNNDDKTMHHNNSHRYVEIEVNHSLYYKSTVFFGNTDTNKQVPDIIIGKNRKVIPSLNDITIQPNTKRVIYRDQIYKAIYTKKNTDNVDDNKKDFQVSVVTKLRDYNDTMIFATNKGNNTSYSNDQVYPREIRKWNDSMLEIDHGNQYYVYNPSPDNKLLEYQLDSPSDVKYDISSTGFHNMHSNINHIRLYTEKEELTGGTFGDYSVIINKESSEYKVRIDRYRFPIISISDLTDKMTFSEDNLRIWYNGRLISRDMYKLIDYNTLDIPYDGFYEDVHYPRVQILFETKIGDEITVEIYPYKLTEIYTSDNIGQTISSNKVIEFYSSVTDFDKPVDIDYYDFYVNGRKLTRREIALYKPTKAVFMNLPCTNGQLRVFKKERDYEYFGWFRHTEGTQDSDITDNKIYKNAIHNSSLYDRICTGVIAKTIAYYNWYYYGYPRNNNYGTLWNITNNQEYEELVNKTKIPYNDYYKEKIFYYEELITIRLINPNIFQINNHYLKTLYLPIYKEYIQKYGLFKYGNGRPTYGSFIDSTDSIIFDGLKNLLDSPEFKDEDNECVYIPLREDNVNVVHLNPNKFCYEYDKYGTITNFSTSIDRDYENSNTVKNKMVNVDVYMLGNYESLL